jgi:hypothetical protein
VTAPTTRERVDGLPEEFWTRDGQTLIVPIGVDGTVQVAIEILRNMLLELGFTQVVSR